MGKTRSDDPVPAQLPRRALTGTGRRELAVEVVIPDQGAQLLGGLSADDRLIGVEPCRPQAVAAVDQIGAITMPPELGEQTRFAQVIVAGVDTAGELAVLASHGGGSDTGSAWPNGSAWRHGFVD